MRLYLKLRSENKLVPFNYQPQLTQTIHKWLGRNEWHDAISLYSFSWLQGGRLSSNNLLFENGANWELSAYNEDVIKQLIKGIQSDPGTNFGMVVSDITIRETPRFLNKEVFHVASPVFVKRKLENKEVHFMYDNDNCSNYLTETLKTKLRKAGLSEDDVKVSFWKSHPSAKSKLAYYNEIGNRVNVCPVIIEGTPEQIGFAWNVGVGNSTGIGFGALK